MGTDRFDDFFRAYKDELTDEDHQRLWSRTRIQTARLLYDQLVDRTDGEGDRDIELDHWYSLTCHLCGILAFGEAYRAAAEALRIADMRARSPSHDTTLDERERDHDCCDHSDYRPEPPDYGGSSRAVILDPYSLLEIVREVAVAKVLVGERKRWDGWDPDADALRAVHSALGVAVLDQGVSND